jgi:hypothetical protein
VALKAAKILAEKINDTSFDLQTFIPDSDPETMKGNAVLVKGKLGLANGASEWEDFFKDQEGYCSLIIDGSDHTILSVRFKKDEEFKQFLNLRGWGTYELSLSDVTAGSGEILKLIGNYHLLIRINQK